MPRYVIYNPTRSSVVLPPPLAGTIRAQKELVLHTEAVNVDTPLMKNMIAAGILVVRPPSIESFTIPDAIEIPTVSTVSTFSVPYGSATPSNVDATVGTAGISTDVSRADHEHQVTTAAPVDIGTANAAGVSTDLARADHQHNLPFSSVNNALSQANASISVNSQRITDLLNPVNPQDAATKAYTDALTTGLDVKASVRALSDAPITLSGAQTIDGVAVSVGERVLVAGQGGSPTVAHIDNGIYVVAAGAWTRATDMPSGSGAASVFTFVEDGTLHDNAGWVFTNSSTADIVGTNLLAATQFSGAGQITAGAGLTKLGNQLDVVANADGSITVNANDIQVGILASDVQHGVRGGGTQHAVATTSVAGFMSAPDKTKLDGISSGAAALTSSAPVNVTKSAAVVGVATDAARADHKHDITTAVPSTLATGGVNTEGTATSLARSDHVHALTIVDGVSFVWGNSGVTATTTTRYLTPGYTDTTALTTPVQFRAPFACTARRLYIRHNTPAGNGNSIVYTLRVNGTASSLTVSIASTSADGNDLLNTVAIVAGDLIDIEVTKAASIATSPSNITASLEFAA